MTPRLLCTDLDRTLLPNGDADESPGAREIFARVVSRPGLALAYVTGRHLESVDAAREEFGLPRPDFAICDVGSSIYQSAESGWQPLDSWHDRLASEWPSDTAERARRTLEEVEGLDPQGDEHQSRFKLSFFCPAVSNPATLLQVVERNLAGGQVRARAIYSVDETRAIGLLDLLPPGSGKLGAIEHLLGVGRILPDECLFAGDSGNDLEVLDSPIPSVLVANAADDVRREALHRAHESGRIDRLHLARGGLAGMNGNYAAGILEGLVHFWPATRDWIG